MKKIKFLLIVFLSPLLLFSQENSSIVKANDSNLGGSFELGIRSTTSTFGSTGNLGYGIGGQFRIRMSNRVNTEWFSDFITEDIDGLAKRNDYHIGWSVMFYPINPIHKKITPYILAGHCFDYTKITTTLKLQETETASKLSSATQIGLGTHFNLTDKFNISLSSQYMLHLGNDIHTEVHRENGHSELHIESDGHGETVSLEGHILYTISINYKIANLW